MEATRGAVAELEAAVSATAAAEALLEELGELAAGEAPCERVAALLLRGGVVRVVAVVEALAKLGVTEYLVRLVDRGHLRFAAALVRMRGKDSFPAMGRERKRETS